MNLNTKHDDFKTPLVVHPNQFLGKKTLKLSIIKEKLEKNNKGKESDSDSDEDLKKYKNIMSGKFNMSNIIKGVTSDTDKDWTPDDYKNNNISTIKKPAAKTKSNELLSILPKPKNKTWDKTSNQPSVKLTNKEQLNFNLNSNPDEINENTYSESTLDKRTIYGNVKDVSLDDIIDKNWETKYVAGFCNKDDDGKKRMFEPTKTQKSKHHITSLAYDYLSTQGEEELKKASDMKRQNKTKTKYGW